ncbi:MAG TPA: hypothetical protein VGP68_24275 [Gemmataceae bacterium]|jgi:hypothetical protein|nr:hypothetical protein [Gemmataceae bacterium]
MRFSAARFISKAGCRFLGPVLLANALLTASASLAPAQAPQGKAVLRQRLAVEMMAVPAQEIPEARINQLIFQPDRTPEDARRRLDSVLALQVEDIDKTCQLTPEQKHKVELTGRGDIKRFFDQYESIKAKFQFLRNDRQTLTELSQDTRPLQMALQAGLFHDDSLLRKSLSHTLTNEQFERYDSVARERRKSRHLATIASLVNLLERATPFTDAKRKEFIAFLAKEIPPNRRPGPYGFYVLLGQMGQVPEEKLKPLLDDKQWQLLNQYRDQYQAMEPILRKAGYLPPEDAEDEKPNAPATAPKK